MALSEAITSLRSDNEDLKAVKFATMTNYLPAPHSESHKNTFSHIFSLWFGKIEEKLKFTAI